MSVAESIVTFGPMLHVGCASARSGVARASSSSVAVRNGPPEPVRTSSSTAKYGSGADATGTACVALGAAGAAGAALCAAALWAASSPPPCGAPATPCSSPLLGAPAIRHWNSALCSLSTGTTHAPEARAAATTNGPPATMLSLFARARVAPDSRAARVGRRPIAPVIPLRTTSAPMAAAVVAASAPTTTSGAYAARPAPAAYEASAERRSWTLPAAAATKGTSNSTAWRAKRSILPPAASARTVKRSRLRPMTSRAWVPIDPVEPRMLTVREITGAFSPTDLTARAGSRGSRGA